MAAQASFTAMYALMLFLLIKRKITPVIAILFVCMELYLLFIFFFSHIVRFAIPALVLAAILIALAADALTARSAHRFFSAAAGVFAAMLFAASIASTTLSGEIQCLLGIQSSATCDQKTAGAEIYPTQYINAHLQNETVLEYWNVYYIFRLTHGNNYSRFYCAEESDAAIRACLTARDISYLVDDTRNSTIYAALPERDDMKYKIRMVEYFKKYGTIIYEFYDEKENSYLRLYSLK